MSKYDVVDLPLALPGKCLQCGSSKKDGRGYVQINTELVCGHGHPYGTLYLCGYCFEEIARAIGYLSIESAKELMELVAKSTQEIERLDLENARLRRALSELVVVYPSSIDSNTTEPESPDGNVSDSGIAQRENTGNEGTTESDEGSESGLSEQNNEQGYTSLHNDDVVEKLLSGKLE